jgi:hypothetical protein
MVRPKNEVPTRQLSVRVPAAVADQIDEMVAKAQAGKLVGAARRVDILRAVIEAGIPEVVGRIAAQTAAAGSAQNASRPMKSTARKA